MSDEQQIQQVFESEVRRVARELFPKAQHYGPINVDGRERDGVFHDGEVIHIVEATVSKKREKARYDLEKSSELVKSLRRTYPNLNFKIWFVTKYEVTSDQVEVAERTKKSAKCPVEACSYRTFTSKLIDAPRYIDLRKKIAFGSIRNPERDSDFYVPESEYVPMDFLNVGEKKSISISDLCSLFVEKPNYYLLLGDFGAGKSMSMRYMFNNISSRYLVGDFTIFSVYLNLRDHFGQTDPAEALIRHGNKIGLTYPSQLVSAWRSGHCHIFLDGFDELSSTRLVRGVASLKLARREAMQLIKAFYNNHPRSTSIIVAGRQNYFDSLDELKIALAVPTSFVHLTLNEFTQDQVEIYLGRKGYKKYVPSWLPSRPLLLGYLAIKGILSGDKDLSTLGREEGWNYLIDRICEREANQIDSVSIDPHAVREFVERLATEARRYGNGRGPIRIEDVNKIFQEVFSVPPDEKAATFIFRLPGLTAATGQEDAREFIDDDYVDACRSGDIVRFIANPYDGKVRQVTEIVKGLGDLGCSISAFLLRTSSPRQISAALQYSTDKSSPYIAFDLVRILQQLNADYTGDTINIVDGFFDEFQIANKLNLANIVFRQCYFSKIEVDGVDSCGPRFENCEIDTIYGCVGLNDLPNSIRNGNNGILKFENEASTNADILDLPLPMSTRVFMTILRKIFIQSGRGRKENALYRGLDDRARVYVPEILRLLEQCNFISPQKINGPVIWYPDRSRTREVKDILQSPQAATDTLSIKIRSL